MNSYQANQWKGHLDEDQFADCMIGLEPDTEVAAHLAGCEACREEMERFGSAVNAFNRAAAAWSRSRPTSRPEAWRELRPVARPELRRMVSLRESRPRPVLVTAAWALAACTVVGVGMSVVQHREQGQHAAGVPAEGRAAVGPAQEDSAAQIAQDNKLLLEVDRVTRSDDRSVVEEYGLRVNADAGRRTQRASD
jgi:predicted anti-sigma-YlaC factor YlaD